MQSDVGVMSMRKLLGVLCGITLAIAGGVFAESIPRGGPMGFASAGMPLLQGGKPLTRETVPFIPFQTARADAPSETTPQAGSLFIGQTGPSFFAPYPARLTHAPQVPFLYGGSRTAQLRDIIGHAEARHHGYDAVQHGARVRPDKLPTQMTLAEIFAWIDATPGQPHAIGRYQFIPKTLRWLVDRLGVRDTAAFTPALQDQLADLLLQDAGYAEFQSEQITRHAFMNNLAQIWAGLPTSSGQSYYHGYAGNKASLSWADFDAQMQQVFGTRAEVVQARH
jgi:muramidase (phage lysozyme)